MMLSKSSLYNRNIQVNEEVSYKDGTVVNHYRQVPFNCSNDVLGVEGRLNFLYIVMSMHLFTVNILICI